jgi:general secretion pathway protein F
MPVYAYKGLDSRGKNVSGTIDAENERIGRIKLRKSGVFPTSLKPEGRSGFSFSGGNKISFLNKVKVNDLANMTRQLATLMGANIPLVGALGALQDQLDHPILKKSISRIKEKVVEGQRLADAMKQEKNIFNDLYIHMIRAGEASGALEEVLSRLADFTEYQAKLKSKISGAMIYPIIMSVIGVGIMIYLLTSVVPQIAGVFADSDSILPLPTRVVLFLSDTVQNYWYFIIGGAFLLFFLFKKYAASEKGSYQIDVILLKLPVIGTLVRKIAISRFARTLATLLKSGVQLLTALDIVKYVVGNKVLSNAIETAKDSIREGESVADPLKRSGHFPPMIIHMIAVGEKTGSIESMLERVADSYDDEVDAAVGGLTSLLEPLMIIVMGGMVGGVVAAVMLPILQMSDI